jgi:isocitrate lyase
MLHHITIRKQAIYTKSEVSRLALATFRNALSRMSIGCGRRCKFVATERIKHMNYQPRGISDQAIQGPASYLSEIGAAEALLKTQPTWNGVTAEAVARMRLQNRFRTGLDVARYTAALMRSDMAAYDGDPTKYTQSLGCWHGFIAQQKLISVKKHFGTTDRRYLYLSGWMIAALRSEFGPLPDQSMHEKTSVPALIEELYTFLRQADSRELNDIFRGLDAARKAGDKAKEKALIERIDNFQTHVVPVIADIDAGFGNAEATYLLAKKMIEAGACALQIENQVSDEKQCGHQDGKVTVPHEVFLAKIRACRHAFLELGVEDGIIVTRTDSLGAGLTQQIAFSHKPGDLGDQYNSFLDCEEVTAANARNGDVIINRDGKMMRPKRLASNLYQFRAGTGEDRCVLDCITSLQNGADLLWIETEKPHIEQIAKMVDRIREVIPNAKLAYNNSPSFNWTLNFRWQVYDAMKEAGKDVSRYNRAELMKLEYDDTPLAIEADERIRTFQADSAKRAGIFHHLITLPTYHTTALSTDNLAKEYFGEQGMLGYVKNVQRQEIRQGIACARHQNMAGSDIGDDHKEYFAGEAALKAGGAHNTMNQFG